MSQKTSPEEAEYRAYPNGDEQCSGCSMWIRPDGCAAGDVRTQASGWCEYWEQNVGKSPFAKSANKRTLY